MLRKMFIHFIIIVLIACSPNNQVGRVKDSSELVDNLLETTVALIHINEDFKSYCTGVFVSLDDKNESNLILTAKHCVKGLARNNEVFGNLVDMKVHYSLYLEHEGIGEEPNTIHLAKVVKLDNINDLALLKTVSRNKNRAVKLGKISPAIGEDIYIMGHPIGFAWTFIRGNVSQYRGGLPGDAEPGPYMQLSAPIFFGNSGGGVFNRKGELCAIVVAITRAPLLGLAVPLPTIHKFLEPYR